MPGLDLGMTHISKGGLHTRPRLPPDL